MRSPRATPLINPSPTHMTAAEIAAEVEEMFSGPAQLPAPPVPAKH
jgi:hypothetical protein